MLRRTGIAIVVGVVALAGAAAAAVLTINRPVTVSETADRVVPPLPLFTAAPPSGPDGVPTASSTGPRVANPAQLGRVEVHGTENLTDVVLDSIIIYPGGQLTARNIRVTGSLVVLPETGAPVTKVHLIDSAVHSGTTINVSTPNGVLDLNNEVPVDIFVSGSWLNHPHDATKTWHTEAVAGFGRPQGARFINTAFIQEGPFNGTATAAINWHGADTVFDGCYFGYTGGTAAYYTVYVEGRNNIVKNSTFAVGLAGYVYPDSNPKATYSGIVDAAGGAPVHI